MGFSAEDITFLSKEFKDIRNKVELERKETDKSINVTNDSIVNLDRISVERVRAAAKAHEDTHHPDGRCKDTVIHEAKFHDWPKFWKMIGTIVTIAGVVGTGLLWVLNKIIQEAVKNGGTP